MSTNPTPDGRTTVYIDGIASGRRVTCPRCHGDGYTPGPFAFTHPSCCHRCDGSGMITIPLDQIKTVSTK